MLTISASAASPQLGGQPSPSALKQELAVSSEPTTLLASSEKAGTPAPVVTILPPQPSLSPAERDALERPAIPRMPTIDVPTPKLPKGQQQVAPPANLPKTHGGSPPLVGPPAQNAPPATSIETK